MLNRAGMFQRREGENEKKFEDMAVRQQVSATLDLQKSTLEKTSTW